MDPPFPGMDPYLESSANWSGFHHHLAEELMTMLNARLDPKYFADVEVRSVVDDVGIATTYDIYPDVSVLDLDPETAPAATAPTITAPLQRVAVPAERAKSRTVHVRLTETKALVTAIEILSFDNKRGRGLEQYRQKRERLLYSSVHLVELDLLRRGRRPGWEVADPPLETAYVCLVNRARYNAARISEIWPVALDAPLPTLPIPLLPADPDILIEMQAALRQIYHRAAYARRIDYQADPPPPDLVPAEVAWLDARLRECGLRA
jgi:hypothetical protein